MKTAIRTLLVLAVLGTAIAAQSPDGDVLSIYLVDVEGGGATLFVSPTGESMLMDTGNGGANADRDVSRIMAAAEDAGLERIDHLLTTHWHGDHYGGLAELATRIPIGHYIDHGPTIEDNERVQAFIDGPYRELYNAARRTVVTPGDTVPLSGVDVQVMASAGEVVDEPLPGAGEPNPYCADFERYPEDLGDNAQSAGVHLQFGRFRALHLGDLTANKEFELMCPNNPIGSVDLYVVSHHGLNTSNAQVLVHGVAPRVAIMVMFGAWALVLGFNILTLPVEADATERAKEVLRGLKLFRTRKEQSATFKMTKAAGLMYVSGVINTLRWLISCLFPGSRPKG